MSTMAVAFVAENAVIGLAIGAAWSLLRQGGGLQVKPVPVPKKAPEANREPQAGADETAPLPKVRPAA